ncbi:hypothetical protein K5549_019360, partial [Capra hircus]
VHLSASDPRAQGGVQHPGSGLQVLTLPSDPGDPEGRSEEGAGTSGGASGPVPLETEMDVSEFLMPIDEEEDSRESALCGRKLPLWLGLLLLLAVVGLLVPLIYFAVRANSKACVDGLQAQKECQELNKHLQRQLNQPQEVLHEKEAEAATCKQTVATLKDSLKKEQARVDELQGELANLNQQVDDLSEKLRRKSEDSAKDYASSFFDVFLSFFGGVVTTRVVSITRKCLKK